MAPCMRVVVLISLHPVSCLFSLRFGPQGTGWDAKDPEPAVVEATLGEEPEEGEAPVDDTPPPPAPEPEPEEVRAFSYFCK